MSKSKRKHRILWNVRGDDIDEVVFDHPTWVHVEQMHNRCWWIGVRLPDGGYWAGNFHCDSRGRMTFTEQDSVRFEWADDGEHRRKAP